MQTLTATELQDVNGGIIPLIIGIDVGLNLTMLALGYGAGAFE
ncbi:class IIb bacteriocin, lactobin A/cerein 7B family [Salinimonas chungwhensis]|nr:class IIb bacteriocin, lactobin A/cerein 7B family [Salinimonas chungwhensis]